MSQSDNWDQHWSDYDVSARYNPAQAFRRELIIHWLKEQPLAVHSRLLDIGSGQGDLIASLMTIFPSLELAGVEMSAIGIDRARVKASQACFYQRNLLNAPEIDDPLREWASLAVCSEVLEHVDAPEALLLNASAYLKPGALLFITVPGGPRSAYDRHLGHRKHFTKASLSTLITDAGLIPEQLSSTGFPFFNLYKVIVMMRGASLIKDASIDNIEQLSIAARLVLTFFSIVLKRCFNNKWRGWQMTALARKPYT